MFKRIDWVYVNVCLNTSDIESLLIEHSLLESKVFHIVHLHIAYVECICLYMKKKIMCCADNRAHFKNHFYPIVISFIEPAKTSKRQKTLLLQHIFTKDINVH